MNRLCNIMNNRLKILYKSKTIIVLSLIMIGLFTILVGMLYESAEESSKIPVAVIDKDLSDLSKGIMGHLRKEKILNIIEVDESTAIGSLKEGKLEAVYILKQGLSDNINNENYNDIIDVYYLKGSTIAKFIGDIFAEKVLRDLCLVKSVSLLERAVDKHQLENKQDILKDAYNYGLSLQDYSHHQYYVKVDFVSNNSTSINTQNVDNSLIYKKMILGIIVSFIAFFLLFASISIVKDKETNMLSRIQVSSTKNVTIILGNYLSLIVSGGILSFVFGIVNGIYSTNNHFESFIGTFFILIIYVISLSSLIMLFTSIIDKVATHIMIFTILILIMGVVSGSFFSIDLLSGRLKNLSYLIPNYWTMKTLMASMTMGHNTGDLWNYTSKMLLYSGVMIVMTFCIYKFRKKVER